MSLEEDVHLLAERIRKLSDDALVKLYKIALTIIQKDLTQIQRFVNEIALVSPVVAGRESLKVSDSVSFELRKGDRET